MGDQAEALRKLADEARDAAATGTAAPQGRAAKVITVTSGKGGVGKTNMTVNLGIALSRMGLKVVILDVDFGLANIDVLFGVVPKHTLVDLIRDERNIFEVLTNGPENVKFLSGGSGVEELVRLDNRQLKRFVGNIALLDKLYDVILIDTAGRSQNDRLRLGQLRKFLEVASPDETHLVVSATANRACTRGILGQFLPLGANRVILSKLDEADCYGAVLNVAAWSSLAVSYVTIGQEVPDDIVAADARRLAQCIVGGPQA